MLFEIFDIDSLFLQDTSVLSLYAMGKVSGCVIDVGHTKIDISTVYDGLVNSQSMRRIHLTGEMLTQHMRQHLSKLKI